MLAKFIFMCLLSLILEGRCHSVSLANIFDLLYRMLSVLEKGTKQLARSWARCGQSSDSVASQ